MWESTNPNMRKEYSLHMILMDDNNKLTISDVFLLVILLYLFCSSDMFVVVNFCMIYFAHKKILFMHYLFVPFKQLLSEACL